MKKLPTEKNEKIELDERDNLEGDIPSLFGFENVKNEFYLSVFTLQ